MIYLVSYDIPSTRPGDKRRSKLARFLAGRGLRVQYSVFELELSPERMPILIEEIYEIIDDGQDSVRIYPMCASCTTRVQHLGLDAVIEREGLLVW